MISKSWYRRTDKAVFRRIRFLTSTPSLSTHASETDKRCFFLKKNYMKKLFLKIILFFNFLTNI